MQFVKPKIIVICGPTASGKSDAAISLAKKIDGEIISADSRQVYKRLNLGSGKVLKDKSSSISNNQFPITKHNEIYFSEGVIHHLIDVANPEEDFNVSHFKKAAEEAVEKIIKKNKVPIICGGTGFWISSFVDNVVMPEVKPNEKLRSELGKKSNQELFEILAKQDPKRAKNIDNQNPVRLIRAIEIATTLGKVPQKINSEQKYDFLQIGIDVPREILNEKIKKRLDDRFTQGMLLEVENLLEDGVSPRWLERIGLEYRWLARYKQNKISFEEMKQKLYFDIIHYAKRQMTWFGKDQRIIWTNDKTKILELVRNFLK